MEIVTEISDAMNGPVVIESLGDTATQQMQQTMRLGSRATQKRLAPGDDKLVTADLESKHGLGEFQKLMEGLLPGELLFHGVQPSAKSELVSRSLVGIAPGSSVVCCSKHFCGRVILLR